MNFHHDSVAATVRLGSLRCRARGPARSFWQRLTENRSRHPSQYPWRHRVLGIANANGDCASWSRHAGNLRANFPACRHKEPNGTVAATKFLGYWLLAIGY